MAAEVSSSGAAISSVYNAVMHPSQPNNSNACTHHSTNAGMQTGSPHLNSALHS
eukprot:CAMPEP_0179159042 /NCGR_PEP_ID=MMETSP0796-20121207/77636_1 /TAXON_ID=73915 /ORGANISM="Pyrodinium bahamense, Strain pbaha01" /LENGTH=53 /DNA_ID=CAMNT_0020860761 /DNA_START=56 /DNA_END=214 /DNA_ORIENTATION=+